VAGRKALMTLSHILSVKGVKINGQWSCNLHVSFFLKKNSSTSRALN
jgi:hypothetical protein